MKLRPLHDRVVVKRLDNERTTASGIVIPDNALKTRSRRSGSRWKWENS